MLVGNWDPKVVVVLQDTNTARSADQRIIFFPTRDNTTADSVTIVPDCVSDRPVLRNLSLDLKDPNNVPIHYKPMYSERDQVFDFEKTCYHGRRLYYPMDYLSTDTHAIFEIIALEDRLLLKTAVSSNILCKR